MVQVLQEFTLPLHVSFSNLGDDVVRLEVIYLIEFKRVSRLSLQPQFEIVLVLDALVRLLSISCIRVC